MQDHLIQYLANRRIPDVVCLDDQGVQLLDENGTPKKRTVEHGELVLEANFWPNTEQYLSLNWLIIAGMQAGKAGPRPGPQAKPANFTKQPASSAKSEPEKPKATRRKKATRKASARKKTSTRATRAKGAN